MTTGAGDVARLSGSTASSSKSFLSLARDSAIFATGAVAGKLVGLLLLPILTRLLSSAEFGRLDILSNLVSALVAALMLGFDVAATRLYPDGTAAQQRRLFSTWYVLNTGVTLLPISVLIIFANPISRLLFNSASDSLGVAMVGLAILSETWLLISLTLLRNQQRAAWYAGVSGGTLVLNGILTVILLELWHSNASAVMVAMVVSQLAGWLFAECLVWRQTMSLPSRQSARALLALTLPLAPAVVAMSVGDFANRAILLGAAGAAEVGYLSVAVRFGTVAVLVVVGFQLAWEPRTFARKDEPGAAGLVSVEAMRIVVTVGLVVVALGLLSPELLRVLASRKYARALPAIGFELIFALAVGLFVIATMPSALDRKMADIGLASGVAVGATLLGNGLLAPAFHSAGTAASMAVGQLCGVLVALQRGRSRVDLRIPWLRVLALTSAAATIVVIATVPRGGLPWPFRILLGVFFLAVLIVERTLLDGVRLLHVRYRRSRHGSESDGH